MDERGPLTDEGWRALTSDLVAVVRRYAPGWTDVTEGDPGTVLVDLFAWLADALEYRAGMIGEGSLGTRRRLGVIAHHVLSDASPVVTVDGIQWRPTPSLTQTTPDDRAYAVESGADGTTTLVFGDGRSGARPPAPGSEVAATYRSGAGAARLTAIVRWPPEPATLALDLDGRRARFEPARPCPRGLIGRLLAWFRRE